jgi:hypothetical protein
MPLCRHLSSALDELQINDNDGCFIIFTFCCIFALYLKS